MMDRNYEKAYFGSMVFVVFLKKIFTNLKRLKSEETV